MEKSVHNQRYMENHLKLKYKVDDSFELYNFVGQDLRSPDVELDDSVAATYAVNQEKAAETFLEHLLAF